MTDELTLMNGMRIKIKNVRIECNHGPGPATCPACGKPCEQELADMQKRAADEVTGRD